jgi:outer membrane protein insertion porin family
MSFFINNGDKPMKTLRILTSVIALAAAGILGAAEVGAIKFDQKGSSKLPENQLFFNIKLRKGMQFNQETVDSDIKRLYGTGNFADVVSEVETAKDGKVNVTYKTTL